MSNALKPKILVTDNTHAKAAEILRDAGFDVDVEPPMKPEELKAVIAGYAGIIVRSSTKLTPDIIEAAANLKVIGRAGTGIDNIDIPAATEKGVLVMNANGNTVSAAEHTIGMMFALARRIPAADRSLKDGRWDKKAYMGAEITGKTLGVIGLGKIGSAVAERALGLKMQVIAYDPEVSVEAARKKGVTLAGLDEVVANADFITLHTPALKEGKPLLDREKIFRCKKGAYIINCARGGLVDAAALREALEQKHIAGAALDVFKAEPLFGNDDADPHEKTIVRQDNVVGTPHLGAATGEAQERVALMIANQMKDFLLTGAISGGINAPSLAAEDREKLGPHLMLAAFLGSTAGQLTPGERLEKVVVEYAGEAAQLKTGPLTLTGLEWLYRSRDVNANLVNVLGIAKERGVDVQETTLQEPGDYQTLMRFVVGTEKRTLRLEGSLLDKEPTIVKVDDVRRLRAGMAPYALFIRSANVPGMVGIIGTLLGEHGVNIENIHMGKTTDERSNISFFEVQQEVSKRVIDALKEAGQGKICEVRPLNQGQALKLFGKPEP